MSPLAPSAPSSATRGHIAYPLRVQNPAQYAREKAAADQKYSRWAVAHPYAPVFGSPLTASLNKPGMNASVDNNGLTPPDTTGAISSTNYVEFVNSQVGVFNRSLTSVATVSEDIFTASSSTCDGQIKFDQAAGRFLYWSLDCAAAPGGEGFSFGWSKTASPTPLPSTTSGGNWCRFHVVTGSELEDYGKLGQNNSFMIVGTNEFDDSIGYDGSPIFAINKPANGTTTCPSAPSLRITKFVPPPADEFTPEPANISGSSANGFIVAISGSLTNALRMYTLSGSGSTLPTLTDNGNITVPAFSVPASVPQPGSSDRLDSLDARLTQATAANDPSIKAIAVWTQHTVAGPNGGPAVVHWYELKAGQAIPVQSGTIDNGSSGLFTFNGAIAPTRIGNAAAIDYDVGGSAQQVLVREQDRAAGAAAGTLGAATLLATSTGIDRDFSCPSQRSGSTSCRWGDYAGASTDPAGCGAGVWGSNQFNGTPSTNLAEWQTQNFSLLADECPTAAFTSAQAASPAHTENLIASTSSDPDGSIASYKWTFGDGSTLTTTTATTSHTYATAGTRTVTLTVTDSAGLLASVSHSVTVS